MRDPRKTSTMSQDEDEHIPRNDPEIDQSRWANDLEDRVGNISKNARGACTSDRTELMERIKKGESPTWVPSKAVSLLYSLSGKG